MTPLRRLYLKTTEAEARRSGMTQRLFISRGYYGFMPASKPLPAGCIEVCTIDPNGEIVLPPADSERQS